MITEEESIPTRSSRYLAAQDILWVQFNQVNFYVEDKDQENFYFIILKKIFSNVSFERIFPLNGKPSVIEEAKNSLDDNKKVFLLDLDFDEILERKLILSNLFYLSRYSIENYLVEEEAIYEIVREFKPKIKEDELLSKFHLNTLITQHKKLLADIASSFLVVQKHNLGLKYLKLNPPGDIRFENGVACFRTNHHECYLFDVEVAMKNKDRRLKINSQISKLEKHFKTEKQILNNVPGKYILNIIKFKLERLFSLPSMTLDSFTYRLAKNCILSDLNFLRNEVIAFIS